MKFIIEENINEFVIKKNIKQIRISSIFLSILVLTLFSFFNLYGILTGNTNLTTHLATFFVLIPFHLFWQLKALSPLRDKNIKIVKNNGEIRVNDNIYKTTQNYILKINLGNYRSTNNYRVYLELDAKKELIFHNLDKEDLEYVVYRLTNFLNFPIKTLYVSFLDSLI